MTTIVVGPADQQGMKVTPWTAMEQQLLEQALKTYPASTPERWDRIAECLPTRSKKDCMKRYKVHNIMYNTWTGSSSPKFVCESCVLLYLKRYWNEHNLPINSAWLLIAL
jgi:hypothetical protein